MTGLVYLIGPLAAGKSTIGKKLAQSLEYDWIDTDREIIRRTGVDIVWIFDQEGESGFRKREYNLLKELSSRKKWVISTGGGSILDENSREIMQQTGIVVYLQVSLKKQLQRTEKDRVRPLLQTKDKHNKLKELAEQREKLYQSIADIQIATDSDSVDKIVKDLTIQIEKHPKFHTNYSA
jgi:shikimate kinase